MKRVLITFDVEQDCPPFRDTYGGIEKGLPKILNLLNKKEVKATFFTTGDVASKYPKKIYDIINGGHELGSHGLKHLRYDKISTQEMEKDLIDSTEILRTFYNVVSFRAPNLQFPKDGICILKKLGFKIDSTKAKHKNPFIKMHYSNSILRLPVTTTSLILRLNKPFRNVFLRCFKDPIVLMMHPWEFIDLRSEDLRFDCRFRTGDESLKALEETIDFYKSQNANFIKMQEML